jgi:hypothetical protein
MAFEDPWLLRGQTSPIEFERRMYAKTENPIHVVRVLEICLELQSALPDWVAAYLQQRLINHVKDLFNEGDAPSGSVPATLAAALGFQKAGQGVRETAYARHSRALRELHLAGRVRRERGQHPDYSLETIMLAIAEAEQISVERVRRAWQSWRDFLEDTLLESAPPLD